MTRLRSIHNVGEWQQVADRIGKSIMYLHRASMFKPHAKKDLTCWSVLLQGTEFAPAVAAVMCSDHLWRIAGENGGVSLKIYLTGGWFKQHFLLYLHNGFSDLMAQTHGNCSSGCLNSYYHCEFSSGLTSISIHLPSIHHRPGQMACSMPLFYHSCSSEKQAAGW